MKEISLREVVAQNRHDEIWVTNITKGDRRGNVFFTVANAQGTREDQVNVPATFIPINLTNQVTRDQLLGSSSFRKAVNHGLIRLITPEDAEKFMQEEDSKREWEAVRAQMIDSISGEAQYGMGKDAATTAAVQTDTVTASGISVPVSQFIDLLDTKKDSDALGELRNMGELQVAEYKAVLQRARSLNYEAVGKYVHNQLKASGN